jgi:sirohydrochlorin cobaltochelatase
MSDVPGLLLFAHGARDPNWAVPFADVARRVREQRPAVAVTLAFLEFMSPDIVTAGNGLVAAGCTSVAVVPLFLGAGGHVRKDLPALLDGLRAAHPNVTWRLTPAVGELAPVIAAMAGTALDLLDGGPTT